MPFFNNGFIVATKNRTFFGSFFQKRTAFLLIFLTGAAPPFNPSTSGYHLVFEDEFNTATTIDLADSRAAGFNWYLKGFFGGRVTPAQDIKVANGILTLSAPDRAVLASAAPVRKGSGWHGKVFGGGFYIEAQIAFDPVQPAHLRAWPAFWSMAIEHLQGIRPGTYEDYIEDDIFEDDTAHFAGAATYGGAIHDWYGVHDKTCPGQQYCDMTNNGSSAFQNFVIHAPPTTDWRQFHDFGQLWVPATTGHAGFVQYYLDGRPTRDIVTWPPGRVASPAPFGVMDQDHLVIVLSTGTQTMQVDWVKIWQKPSGAKNETR